jgi:hypothetical protein
VTWTAADLGDEQLASVGVTYGNGLFVAVGKYGTILTSPDGVTWTARTSGTSDYLRSVTYGNGLFVAVGEYGTILTSPDGVTWTAQTSGTGNDLNGVAYGNGLFVAVGGRHHPHLPLNRRSPRPYPAPSPVGRGSLTRGPAGVGAPADLAGTRPLVVGAPPLHRSAPSRKRGTCAPGGGGVQEASSP